MSNDVPGENIAPDPEDADPEDAGITCGGPEQKARPLRLDQFLKLCGVVDTGGQAKQMIQAGEIQVNGEIETRRRRKLSIDDVIEVFDNVLPVNEFFTSG